jgi:hypothetical protein
MKRFWPLTTFRRNPSHRYIGVEIEISDVDKEIGDGLEFMIYEIGDETAKDSSIRSYWHNKKGLKFLPLEIRMAPSAGDAFLSHCKLVQNALKFTKATSNSSCGLHIHVDARDLTDIDLTRLIVLWSRIEKSMFSLVKPERMASWHCKPWNLKGKTPEYIRRNFFLRDNMKYRKSEDMLASLKNGRGNTERNRSLNFLSLKSHETVENRMHQGTVSFLDIAPWAMLNASIVDFAKSTSLSRIMRLPKGISGLLMVAPNDRVKKWVIKKHKYWKGTT